MLFSANYIDKSLYYLPWKTKFIEVFCILYAKLLKKIRQNQDVKKIVSLYAELFRLMIYVLQKKLKSDHNETLVFYSDIINRAEKYEYITGKKRYFEVLNFLSQYNLDKENGVMKFKYQYVDILNEFADKFKLLTRDEGFRDKNYTINDNSYCLWGIEEKSYIKIVKAFLKYEQLKIVRIFGSRVTENYKEFSDIDLMFEGTYTPDEFCKIRNNLQELELPYAVDIFDICLGNKPFTYRNVIRSNIFYSRSDYYEDNYRSIINV